ncbi:hypothetical protein [Candidatus Southlakia epibionticum]|uniref:Uncharacterized protein n=1 Tax=Candidatus Southlakia epibionticum TaxID=3043284 RepID=A0ABY8WY19_9BACT|nr:hypothetical protein SEML1_0523 [Candidatus Saccharimonadaceae bacterium ML1]
MKDDQFTKLFRYMEKRFDEIDKRLDTMATEDDISKVYNILDQHTAMLEDLTAETAALKSSDDRQTRQIEYIARQTGVDLREVAA